MILLLFNFLKMLFLVSQILFIIIIISKSNIFDTILNI